MALTRPEAGLGIGEAGTKPVFSLEKNKGRVNPGKFRKQGTALGLLTRYKTQENKRVRGKAAGGKRGQGSGRSGNRRNRYSRFPAGAYQSEARIGQQRRAGV